MPQAEESQQKDNPQSGEYRTEPDESEEAAEEPKKDSSMPKAPGNTADQAIQPEADSVDSSSADAGAAAQEAPPANESNSLMTAQAVSRRTQPMELPRMRQSPRQRSRKQRRIQRKLHPPHSSVWHRWKTV